MRATLAHMGGARCGVPRPCEATEGATTPAVTSHWHLQLDCANESHFYALPADAYRLKLLLPIGAAARRAELEAAQELEALGLGEEQAGQQAVQQQQLEERLEQQLGEREGGAEQREAEEALVHMQQHGEHDHQAAS